MIKSSEIISVKKIRKTYFGYIYKLPSDFIIIPNLDKTMIEILKTPLREVFPILYPKIIIAYLQDYLFEEYVLNQIIEDV